MTKTFDILFVLIVAVETISGVVFFSDLFLFDMASYYLELFQFCALVFLVMATPLKMIFIVTNFVRTRYVLSSIFGFLLSITNFASLWAIVFLASLISGIGVGEMKVVENIGNENLIKITYFLAFLITSVLFWYFFVRETFKLLTGLVTKPQIAVNM